MYNVCMCLCLCVCVRMYVCGHIYFLIPKHGCEKSFFVFFCKKNGKINHLVSLSNGHGKIKLYFLSTKKKVVKK